MELSKQDILNRLDAQEATQFRHVSYQFFDKSVKGLGGFAQVRFEKGEKILIAETTFWGNTPSTMVEEMSAKPKMVEIKAERQWNSGDYKIISACIDGERYDVDEVSMMELAFAIFTSRIDEIRHYSDKKEEASSIPMSEAFKKAQPKTYARIATREDLYRDALDTVFNEEKMLKAEKRAKSMPRIAFGETIIDFNGLDSAREA